MKKIDFSVVIAVYNGAKTLRRAIDSILDQTHSPREIIVVDDGSTDGTAEIAGAYDPPVRLLRQSRNRGVSAARNAGVEAAQGEWIAFLDADDYYYPNRLALTAKLIANYPDVEFVTADFDYRDENGRWLRHSMESTSLGKKLLERGEEQHVLMEASDFGDFIQDHFGDTHTLTLPREKFLALGGYPEGFAVCEDVHFLIRLCASSQKAGVVKVPVAAYVIHPHSATRSEPLRAQRQTVAAWRSLKPLLAQASPVLKAGFRCGLRRARFDLAIALLRAKNRKEALQAVLPLVYEAPSLHSLKTIGSVLKG
ncbi:MAG: glycosyltransferase family 2 protein [Methylohalobius sp. ZOD2]